MENSSLYNSYKTFSNNEFGEIRVLEVNNEPWFVGKDVAEVLGYANTRSALKYHVDDEDKFKLNIHDGMQNRAMTVINEDGLYNLIQKSKNLSEKERNKIIKWLINEKILTEKIVITSRKEVEFICELKEALKPFGIKGKTQYKVLNYAIDYYIPSLKIAIEYDENNHNHYSYEQHESRQMEIEKELGCKFIRVSDKKSNSYNIGLVIKEIFNL